ncbi:uncharacterized protein [Linepithema humile]|uniref:uncharacterized protein n=1 Tax=Linepithema humile TaxID=83485 RepID=UPI00351DB36E
MHRGGGSAGGATGGGIVGGAGGSHRALELEHPSAMPGAPGFHWGAMLAGHHAAAAAGMMQPPMSAGGEYVPAAAHHGPAHPAMPMDLHVHQGFHYFPTRYRDDALCWTDRKPSMDDVGNPTSVNARFEERHYAFERYAQLYSKCMSLFYFCICIVLLF